MHHCVFMHQVIAFFYDGTDAYTMRQKNDHYVYHNDTTVAAPNECPTSTTSKNARPTMKGAHKVCKPTGGFILACVDRLYNSKYTSN